MIKSWIKKLTSQIIIRKATGKAELEGSRKRGKIKQSLIRNNLKVRVKDLVAGK